MATVAPLMFFSSLCFVLFGYILHDAVEDYRLRISLKQTVTHLVIFFFVGAFMIFLSAMYAEDLRLALLAVMERQSGPVR